MGGGGGRQREVLTPRRDDRHISLPAAVKNNKPREGCLLSTTGGAKHTMAQQIVKLEVKGTLFGAVQTRNVFYYGADTTTPGTQQADELAQNLEILVDDFSNLAIPAMTFYEIGVSYWTGTQWQPLLDYPMSISGKETGSDICSYQTAGLMRAITSVIKATGRKFLPGIAESVTLDSQFIAGVALIIVGILADYLSVVQIQFVNWYPGIPSKNAAFAPFTSATWSSLLSTMRRRKPGYGI